MKHRSHTEGAAPSPSSSIYRRLARSSWIAALALPLLSAASAQASVVVNWDYDQRTLWVACETYAPAGQEGDLRDLWWQLPYNSSQRIDLTEFTAILGNDVTPNTAHCYWFTNPDDAEELVNQHSWYKSIDSPYNSINKYLRSLQREKAIADEIIDWQGKAQAFYCDDTLITQPVVSSSDSPASCLPPPEPPPPPTACDGMCDGVTSYGCWCDALCSDVGDCCPGKELLCVHPGDVHFGFAEILQEFDWEGEHYELELMTHVSDCAATEICGSNFSLLNSPLWVGDELSFEVGLGGPSSFGVLDKRVDVYIDYDADGVYESSELFGSFGETSEETTFVFSAILEPATSETFAVPSVDTTMRIELWVDGQLLDTVTESGIAVYAP